MNERDCGCGIFFAFVFIRFFSLAEVLRSAISNFKLLV